VVAERAGVWPVEALTGEALRQTGFRSRERQDDFGAVQFVGADREVQSETRCGRNRRVERLLVLSSRDWREAVRRGNRHRRCAGAGTAGTAATGKKDIEFPAETKIKFATNPT